MANSTKRLYESLYHSAPLDFQNYPILSEPEDQVAEFMKCRRDPIYFMDTYGVIKDPVRGLIPFSLYDFQKDTLSDLLKYPYTIFLKSRQMGISTLTAGFACWLACFWPHQTIVIISIKQDTAIDYLKKVKMIYEHVPPWLKPYPVKWNEAEVELDNGSRLVGSTTTGEAARSGSLSLLIVDEAAFIPKIDKTWTSAQPTLAKGGRAIVVSTPNGVGNFYHESWVNAAAGKSGIKPIELHWSLHPEYDDEWYQDQRKRLGSPKRVAQELDLQFVGSGDTVLAGEILSYYLATVEEPKRVTDDGVWIWEEPQEDEEYILSADVASGGGTDFSTFEVIKKSDLSQVAEFQKKLLPNRFAQILFKYGQLYNYAQMPVEVNGYGLEVNDRLFNQHGYEMLHVEKGSKIGWKTSVKTRPLIVSALESLLGSRKFKLRSKRLFHELSTFIWHGVKAQAMNGSNDDLVMSLGIGLAVYVKENIQYAGFEEAFIPQTQDAEVEMETVLENFKIGNELGEDTSEDTSWLKAR